MFKVVVGHSDDPDSRSAIREVLRSGVEDLQGMAPKAGILLAASDFEHSLILDQINRVFSGIELIGGTTAGEISPSKIGAVSRFHNQTFVTLLVGV
ncbi:hypothetical protein NIES2101_05925 [Calothrix sp. HK-06]|nr:hypothetical protein NIES2101_05925 [Calothrix sp. HK-06]